MRTHGPQLDDDELAGLGASVVSALFELRDGGYRAAWSSASRVSGRRESRLRAATLGEGRRDRACRFTYGALPPGVVAPLEQRVATREHLAIRGMAVSCGGLIIVVTVFCVLVARLRRVMTPVPFGQIDWAAAGMSDAGDPDGGGPSIRGA